MTPKPAHLLAFFLGACGAPLAPCDPDTPLRGAWEYAGRQDPPSATLLTGTLEVTSESCSGFQGQLELLESRQSGETVRLAGPVTGRLVGQGSVRFDAFLGPVPRQHLAQLDPVTVEGTWVLAPNGGAATMTGSFTLRRRAAP